MRRVLAVCSLVVTALVAAASPAGAGGSWLRPARDSYEPGETATMVGYTGGGQLGWIEDGPFFAYLRVEVPTEDAWPTIAPSDVALGPLVLEPTGRGGFQALRVSITFPIPDGLDPGEYEITYCNDPCTTGLGDIVGGTIWVGVEPTHPIIRSDWPPDDPAWSLADPPTTTTTVVPSTTMVVADAAAAAERSPLRWAGPGALVAAAGAIPVARRRRQNR